MPKLKKKIRLGAQEYPCRLTMGAMRRFKAETGHDVSTLQSTDLEGMVTFLWCCVVSASAADGTSFGLSLDEFADRLEPGDLASFYESSADEQKKTDAPS